MKKTALLSAIAALICTAAVNADDTLVKYDFNSKTNWSAPSYVNSALSASTLSYSGLSTSHYNTGSLDNSGFNSFKSWDTSYDLDLTRSNLSAGKDAVSFNVCVDDFTCGEFTSVSLDLKRVYDFCGCGSDGNDSAEYVQAAIFWQDSTGAIQYATSAATLLGGTAWASLTLDFTTFSATLPTDLGSSNYLVEIYAWGGSGTNTLYLDNIALNGAVTADCIPEPGGAMLLFSAGVIGLLVRRRRD